MVYPPHRSTQPKRTDSMEFKICLGCQKSLSEMEFDFSRRSDRRGQLKAHCITCCRRASVASSRGCEMQKEAATGESGGGSYEKRNAILKEIGFRSYREYLSSDLWKRVRAVVFQKKGRKCFCCGSKASQIHHNNYAKDELLGENVKRLVPLCGRCHTRIEFRGVEKATLWEAKAEYKRLRKEFLKPVANL